MPIYRMQCNDCETQFEILCKISEMENPHQCTKCESTNWTRQITAPMICDPVRVGVRKMDTGFREVLQKIHSRAPGSTLNKTSSQL
jgi:putative FmdB family regulatory protein